MTLHRQIGLGVASAALVLCPLSLHGEALASTVTSHAQVRAEVNGKACAAIAVGDVTYLASNALSLFKTPFANLGGGKFAITGGTIQGVVYQGNTYLPWSEVAPKVKATKLSGGGFNFTALPVTHHYQIQIQGSSASASSPAPFAVYVVDNNEGVPDQTIHLSTTGSAWFSGPPNSSSVTDTTDESGSWLQSLNDKTPETVYVTVTWKDPSGHVDEQQVPVKFSSTTATQTVIPADETLVATVPIATFQESVLFNAQANNNDILFQLDTGAFSPLITKKVADALHLPNLGQIVVQGIGGEDNAYMSQITLSLGGVQFKNIPCVVDESYHGTPLLGYSFFADNGYNLDLSQKQQTLSITK